MKLFFPKHKQLLLLKVMVVLFVSTASTQRTTNCEQKFTFFCKFQYDNTFWIGEDLFGECGQSSLIQVFFSAKPYIKKVELAEFGRWEWVEQAKKVMKIERPYVLKPNEKQVIKSELLEMIVEAPQPNTYLQHLFEESVVANCAEQWNQQKHEEGMKKPIFKGINTEMVYYYPRGLYFNYQIESVLVFPESNYLLVMTRNNMKCAGGDTMDGFMIFKFKPQ